MSEQKRWFSTGYLAHGVGSVSPETHALNDAAIIRPGEARGHDIWIDDEFCACVHKMMMATADKGIKARFGHPDMCSDALGTFLGRWKGAALGADGVLRGTLFLSSTASESPKGDLRKYVEEMAAKEPEHFGTSIVFSRDYEAEEAFLMANGATIEFGVWSNDGFAVQGQVTKREDIPNGKAIRINCEAYKSPDARNVKNMPHARCAQLHAADLVDDPAATDGMFAGIGGTALASKVAEYLDCHPEILKALSTDSEMVEILSRYSNELRPFVDRYQANRKDTHMEAENTGTVAESTTVVEPVKTEEQQAVTPPAVTEPETTAEPDATEPLKADLSATKTENESLKLQLQKAESVADEALKAKEDAEQKLKALSVGEPPLTATADTSTATTLSVWDKARAKK